MERLIVACILGTAAFVRLYRIDLTWYFLDQVRDISTAIGIATGADVPLLGPLIGWTSGRLGPLYFYLIAMPFAITGDPLAGFVFAALANVLAVFACYRLARDYFGPAVALCASALFAVFPLAVISSRVLWNPTLVPLFTLLFMRALFAVVVDGRSRSIIWLLAWLAVLTQIHLSTVALGVAAVVALLLWRPRVRPIHALAGAGVFLVLYAPYIAYELAHRLENIRAILRGVGTARAESSEPALASVLNSLLILYRPAIDGFVVAEPWPWLFLGVFSLLYRVEALLFCAGVVLCLWRLVRDRKATAETAIAARRSMGLLLLWLLVPVALFGTRRTALWWYYLDLLYPSQFILAAIALCSIPSLASTSPSARRALGWGAAGLMLAVVATQAWLQIGLQERIERQGQLVFDVPRFSVASARSSLGTLVSLPYGYRSRLLKTLVADFGLPPDGFSRRVHGPVLGRPEENDHLLHRMRSRRAGSRPGSAPSHYLVTDAEGAGNGLDSVRTSRIGPYAIIEYRSIVDYPSWRCALAPRESTTASAGRGIQVALPATRLTLDLGEAQTLVCEGSLRIPDGKGTVEIAVSLVGQAPLTVSREQSQGQRSSPSPSAPGRARRSTGRRRPSSPSPASKRASMLFSSR